MNTKPKRLRASAGDRRPALMMAGRKEVRRMKEEIKKILMAQLQLCHEKSKSEPYGYSLAELSNAVAELAHAYYLFDV